MFENSSFLENSETLERKFKDLNYNLLAKTFVTKIFQTLSLNTSKRTKIINAIIIKLIDK